MAILECRDLSKRFGAVQALDTVSLKIEPGRVIGLLGPNGSGKTTLLKLANGLLTPTGGEILIEGMAPGNETKSAVSYLPDKPYLAEWMKVRQLLDFFQDFYADFDRDKAMEMLLRLNIDENMRIKEMSKGTREKTQLILVMSRKAMLYLLDEPIGGVDPATRDYILDTIIRNYNPEAAVVISTHLIADVEQVLDDVI
ncbi:MAG: ABC transporter ATP-binding protein, partial [Eubacterium sp.]|nr:ABC transporter ATP-binding protein [Eubacterium sp.]